MTAIYCGAGEYKIHFNTMVLVLSETQMISIANYASENDFKIDRNESLEKDNEILVEQIDELTERVSDLRNSLEQIVNIADKELS